MTFAAEKLLTYLLILSAIIVGLVYFHLLDIYYLVGLTIPHPPADFTSSWDNTGSNCFPSATCTGTIYYTTDAKAKTVRDFYVNQLPIDGWQIVSDKECLTFDIGNSCGNLIYQNLILGIKFQITIEYNDQTTAKKKITIQLASN